MLTFPAWLFVAARTKQLSSQNVDERHRQALAIHFNISDHVGPKAAQVVQMVRFGTISDQFGPKAAQVLEMVRPGIVSDQSRLTLTVRSLLYLFRA